jgi:hypothetical protein
VLANLRDLRLRVEIESLETVDFEKQSWQQRHHHHQQPLEVCPLAALFLPLWFRLVRLLR